MISVKNLPPPDDKQVIRTALLSVFDKEGLIPFAEKLHALGVKLISTGGTARVLANAGLPVTEVSRVTGFPEILDGRVKSLHPVIHGGLLARRNDPDDIAALAKLGCDPIDLVVVNLYPFEEATAAKDATDAVAVENIDIGGPAMIRAAAKNFFFVSVLTDPAQYSAVGDELDANGCALSLGTRRALAGEAFGRTARYDAAVAAYFARGNDDIGKEEAEQKSFNLSLPHAQALRYGENPHQKAALYGHPERFFKQLHGKELSFNNLIDLTAALRLIGEFDDASAAVAILKHTNPCGVGKAELLVEAYRKAFATDTQSPFGGIVVANRPLDMDTAQALDEIFTEVVIAPGFEQGVLAFLQAKKNRRVIEMRAPIGEDTFPDVRYAAGGLLVQEHDAALPASEDLQQASRVVTRRAPTQEEWSDLDFAWRVGKHVKSNAIVYAKDGATLGIGAGQMSRIDASEVAVMKGAKSELSFERCVVASDAFFPFADGLLAAASAGARSVIQPGGSVRDEEVIRAADEHDLAMVFTGRRHFRH